MSLRVVVATSDPYLWALKGFAYLFNAFWDPRLPVVVAGYSSPRFLLPANFSFASIGRRDPGQTEWTNGIIRFLSSIRDDFFVFMLEDYWLCAQVDLRVVQVLELAAMRTPGILRMDLTSDRQFAGGAVDRGALDGVEIVETPEGTPYQMSLQAGIWSRGLMLQLLKPSMSPWRVELETTPPGKYRVLGSKQAPVKYANVFKGGEGGELQELGKIPSDRLEHMARLGMLQPNEWGRR